MCSRDTIYIYIYRCKYSDYVYIYLYLYTYTHNFFILIYICSYCRFLCYIHVPMANHRNLEIQVPCSMWTPPFEEETMHFIYQSRGESHELWFGVPWWNEFLRPQKGLDAFFSSQQRTCENKIFRYLKWRYAAYISNIEGLCKGIPTPEVAVKGQHLFFRYLETLVTCFLRRCGGEMGGGLFFFVRMMWMKNMMMVMLLNTRDLQLG